MREPERAVDPTLTKEYQKLFTAASKCAEVCSYMSMHHWIAWPCMGPCMYLCMCVSVLWQLTGCITTSWRSGSCVPAFHAYNAATVKRVGGRVC